MSKTDDLTMRYADSVMNTFGRPQRVLVRGEGCRVWDAEGRSYLDLLAGIAVNSLGHAHPAMVAALTEQSATLGHVSNFFATPWQVELAERLGRLASGSSGAAARVFFANSGAEANEAAFKMTRRTGRTRIVAMEGSFHGRTMGALAVTANPKYRAPFEPLPGDVTFVPAGDEDALAAAMGDDVAAVVVEPIQGENGVVSVPHRYLVHARSLTQQHGALLWIDEVQTGLGRTGVWFEHQRAGITPDIVTVAKGLGGGFPIGACIGLGAAGALFEPGQHGTTFGGNPLGARVALAVLDTIERDELLASVRARGEAFRAAVAALGDDRIVGIRGEGLLLGIVLRDDIAPAVAARALDAGFIVNAPRPGVLRLAPPLIVTDAELVEFADALPGLLDEATA